MPVFNIAGIDRPVKLPDDWSADEIKSTVNALFAKANPDYKPDEQGRVSSSIQTFGREFVGGVGDLLQGAGRVQTFFETPIGKVGPMGENPPPEPVEEQQKRLRENQLHVYGEAIRQGALEDYKTNPRYQGEFFADLIPSALASTAVAAAAGAVGGPVTGGLAYGLQQGEQMAQEAEDAGHPEQAGLAFLGGMTVGAASEGLLGVSQKALGIYKKLKAAGVDDAVITPSLKRIVAEAAAYESAQEGLEQVGQNVIAGELYDEKRTIGKDVLQSALVGGVVGGIVSGGAAGLGKLSRASEIAKKEAEIEALKNDAPATAEALSQTPTNIPEPPAQPSEPAKPSVTLQTPVVDTSKILDELDAAADAAIAQHAGDPAKIQDAVALELKRLVKQSDKELEARKKPEVDQISAPESATTTAEPSAPESTPSASETPTDASNAPKIEGSVGVFSNPPSGPSTQMAEGSSAKVSGFAEEKKDEAGPGVQRQTPIDTDNTLIARVGPVGQTKDWIDADRLLRGVAAIDPELVQEHGPELARAHRELQENPEAGLDAIDRILNSADPEISVHDKALVWAYDIGLRRRRALLQNEAFNPLATVESRAAAQTELQVINDQIDLTQRALKRQGSTWGRIGNFSQRMANSDFTLLALQRQFEEAKQGPLTEEEINGLKRDSEKDQQLSDAILKAQKEKRLIESKAAFEQAVQEDLKEVRTTPEEDPRVASLAERLVLFLENQAASARKRLRERLAGTSSIDPLILGDYAIIGAAHIARGALTIGKFTAAMVNEFGEQVRPHIPEIWAASNKQLDSVVEKNAGKESVKKVRSKLQEKTPSQQIDEAVSDMKERIEDGEDEESLRTLFAKIRRSMVASGIEGVENLIDAIHKVVNPLMPDLPRYRIAELASPYGRFIPLAKDELSIKDRDYRGQLLVTAQIQAMQRGEAPKATGTEREQSSAEKRKLLKLREELKKTGGYVVTDPARQLKTAQDAIKTRLQNEIEDIDLAMEKMERIPNKKRAVTYTDEMNALRDLRNQKRAEYVAMFPPPPLTDTQKAERYSRMLDRQIERITGDIVDGEAHNTANKESMWRPDIAEKKRILKQLIGMRQDIRDRNVEAIREKQTQSALQSMDRQIAAAENEIKNGRIRPWSKKDSASAPELAVKKARLDEAKALRDFLRMADVAARENAEIVRLIAKRTQLEQKLAGSTETREKDQPLNTEALNKLREEIKGLNKQIADKARGPKISADDLSVARKAARLQSAVAKLRVEATKTEFPPAPKKAAAKVDDEILGLQREQADLRSEINKRKVQYALKNRGKLEWTKDALLESLGFLRTLKVGYEASVVGLQGLFFSAPRPVKTAQRTFAFFKALRSQAYADKVMDKIKNHPLYEKAVDAGLKFYDMDDNRVTKTNEIYFGRWAKKLPMNEAFHRASNVFLNTLKMDMFNTFYQGLAFGNGMTSDQAKVMANFVNLGTGYSSLGGFERSAQAMAQVFFAPRFGVSMFRLFSPIGWATNWKGGPRAKVAMALEMGKFLAAISLYTMMLGAYFDTPIEWDPRSPDFMTIRAGSQRIDLLGGAKKPINFWARATTLSTKTRDGEIRSLYDNSQGDVWDLITNILRGSLSVGPSTALTLASGRNPMHKAESPESTFANLAMNMTWSDIWDTLTKEGVKDRILPGIISFFGGRVNTDENY